MSTFFNAPTPDYQKGVMVKSSKIEIELAGRKLSLETGLLAQQAESAVLARYGETIVLATACTAKASEDIDFFPLTVDYEERLYAAGRISGSRFIKREGRPSEEAILTSRLIDRSIRPFFPKDYSEAVQVVITVLSVDQENDPALLAAIATSCALTISDIPWNGPIGVVRVGFRDDQLIINPVNGELELSDLNLIVAATDKKVVMIEADANQVPEEVINSATIMAQKEILKIIDALKSTREACGQEKKQYEVEKIEKEKEEKISSFVKKEILPQLSEPKFSSDEAWFGKTKDQIFDQFGEDLVVSKKQIAKILEAEVKLYLREMVVVKNRRPDGRKPKEIRPIEINVGFLPRTHGSVLFSRGETQMLSIVTLGSPALEQLIEGMSGEETKRYMHHYNFPPFSTGEVKRLGPPSRRSIGHGALAERALVPVIPPEEKFPYTIRVVSEVLSSSGSTSMGAVCGSALALMDAGVPIKETIAGLALGLMSMGKKSVILSDIAYSEDANGEMDLKVAGSKNGITAIQMDVKNDGLDLETLNAALEQAKEGRLQILEKMYQAIPQPRTTLSPYAPCVSVIHIDPAKIGEVIGSGGRTINKIIAETGAAIDIEDDGTVTVAGKTKESCQKAVDWITALVREVKPGEIFEGTVKRILPFGAMVEVLPNKEGLVHISQLPQQVRRVEEAVKIGQKVKVRVSEIDDQGRINLSMRFGEQPYPERTQPSGRHFRNRFRRPER